MDKIDIPDHDIVSLDSISPGVVGLRIVFVNVFAVIGESGWTLIDAGLNGSAGRITGWAQDHFGDEPPAAIVLTHAHFDHVGALDSLLERWDVPVYVHPEEIPYVTGMRAYPPPDPLVGGGLMARLAGLYPRDPINLGARVRPLSVDLADSATRLRESDRGIGDPTPGVGGSAVPSMPGWRTIHTPGHTAGHVSFFRDVDRTLIVGDAFCTTRQESFLAVATQRAELHGPPAYFTTDWDAARDSVARLAALDPAFIAPGHGQPMAGADTREALRELAARFDEVARPEQGRNVEHPVRK